MEALLESGGEGSRGAPTTHLVGSGTASNPENRFTRTDAGNLLPEGRFALDNRL